MNLKALIPSWVVLALAGTALAQDGSVSQLDRFERQMERQQRDTRVLVDPAISPADRAIIDYGGFLSASVYSIDDADGHNHALRQYELVGYGRVNFDGAHELFLRANTIYNDFGDGDAFDSHGDDWEQPKIERAHYRFDLQRALAAYNGKVIEGNVVAQVGRQLVHWGNGVTLDEELDAAVVTLSQGSNSLQLLAGRTYEDIVDFDISRPNFRRDTHRQLYGALLSTQVETHIPYIYGLIQRDHNGSETLDTGGVITRFEYDSYYIGIGSSGAIGGNDNLLYGVEVVYEGGEGLSNSFDDTSSQVQQTEEDIEAWALDARVDYLFADVNRSRVGAEIILASGDDDRLSSNSTFGGNESGTDDHSFNSLGLLNTGLAFAPAVSNLGVLRIGASTFPAPDSAKFKRLQAGVDFFVFSKLVGDGAIDEPTNDHHFLGVETDLFVTWQATSDVTFVVRYGGFVPGVAIEGDSSLRNFFFAGVTYAF